MCTEPPEQIELDFDADPERRYVRGKIARGKARTANAVTLILVAGVVLALVGYTLIAWFKPDSLEQVGSFYEKWLTVVGSLVGAAIGFYFGSTRRHD